jgi:NADH dehydrogenase
VSDVVTGAFSYTGRAIAARLLADGRPVRTLSRAGPGPGDPEIQAFPLRFDDPAPFRGADTFYNTYWIRFEHGGMTFDRAVENTLTLFRTARDAGVRRIVHISVSNPSPDSPYPYFRGKAEIERRLAELGIEHSIVRPTLVFGSKDILVNNIAWILRRFPLFLVPRGEYSVQPVAVEDVARLAVETRAGTVDAAGPETLSFLGLVQAVAHVVRSRARIVRSSPRLALAVTRLADLALRDIVLTRDELGGLRDSLLVSDNPPTGAVRFTDWLAANGETLGRSYVSELARNWRST